MLLVAAVIVSCQAQVFVSINNYNLFVGCQGLQRIP
eukprot:COSAG02_NODE_45284_length_358_cov_1.200772_1_plen_35_part_01